ncbi:MAG TPA: succinate dehydrogenase cytochrome b subunit [Gemmatimonadaceae bacterium]|nr:succinate dehydrogenase cytochrome b subunit [Gemmatimonadaceae bacterium]
MRQILNFWHSTIGKKVVMAVTGLIGVGFVVGHMLGNLQVFEGAGRFNAYAHFLKSLGELLWLARAVLLGAVILHVIAAVQLSRQRLSARPVGYANGSQWEVSTVASRTIRWGGLLLFVFIVFHIMHFTTLQIFRDYSETDVYSNVVRGFSHWWVTLFYVIAMAFLGLHLYHGIWSSMRTIGASRPSANPLRRTIAAGIAAIVWLGFTSIPVAVYFGVVKPAAATAAPATTTAAAAPAATAATAGAR